MPLKIGIAAAPQRLFYFNLGFLRQNTLRRILELSGHSLHLGLPQQGDGVVVWGNSPTAHRGEAVAARRHVPLVRMEDAFVRSIYPGRLGEPPLGLMIDPLGVHYDGTRPSQLEQILARDPLDDSALLARATAGIARMRALDISKYNHHNVPAPKAGYVLVVDQTRGDAALMGADLGTFRAMLAAAIDTHPNACILIKTHPETALGLRLGHFGPSDTGGNIGLLSDAISPWAAVEGAIAVYTVSSQLGFEAILAGHRPHVFGHPFYAGWGLTHDATPHPRRKRRLTRTQLFAAAMILAPRWYDPFRDRLCSFEEALDQLEARLIPHRGDQAGHIAVGMRLWKRRQLQNVFGRSKPLIFVNHPVKAAARARALGRGLIIWAGKEPRTLPPDLPCLRVEDGFIRSRGLGAELVPPLSLVADDLGIYYDPTRPSRLEKLIATPLDSAAHMRAEVLLAAIKSAHLSKYNLTVTPTSLPDHPNRILVPGQVEDDASVRLAAGTINTNLALLRAARTAHPDGFIIYKPHPDVEAGLRTGAIPADRLTGLADMIATHADPIHLIAQCHRVFTMTSTLGFEALLRGTPVTCTGAPFYAGWGLTDDLGDTPQRRQIYPRPDLIQLCYATLIAYPRYHDPITDAPCPPEVVLHRLITGDLATSGVSLRILSKIQGQFASLSHWWR